MQLARRYLIVAPGTVLSVLHVPTHLFLPTVLFLTDKETTAQINFLKQLITLLADNRGAFVL